jgi:predicted ATPase
VAYRRDVAGKPRTGFFLCAESFYNVATEVENLEEVASD